MHHRMQQRNRKRMSDLLGCYTSGQQKSVSEMQNCLASAGHQACGHREATEGTEHLTSPSDCSSTARVTPETSDASLWHQQDELQRSPGKLFKLSPGKLLKLMS